jgi:hypothetical protein
VRMCVSPTERLCVCVGDGVSDTRAWARDTRQEKAGSSHVRREREGSSASMGGRMGGRTKTEALCLGGGG